MVDIYSEGFGRVPKVLMTDGTLTPSQKALYCYLMCYADRDGKCYPSQERICSELGISIKKLQRDISELIKNGWVIVNKHHNKMGWQNNIYIMVQNVPINNYMGQNVLVQNVPTVMVQSIPIVQVQNIPINNTNITRPNNRVCSNHDLNERTFLEFWEVYPKKQHKAKAQEVWCRIAPDESKAAAIVQSVKEWCCSDQWEESSQYIPLPENFLANEDWANVPTEASDEFENREYWRKVKESIENEKH